MNIFAIDRARRDPAAIAGGFLWNAIFVDQEGIACLGAIVVAVILLGSTRASRPRSVGADRFSSSPSARRPTAFVPSRSSCCDSVPRWATTASSTSASRRGATSRRRRCSSRRSSNRPSTSWSRSRGVDARSSSDRDRHVSVFASGPEARSREREGALLSRAPVDRRSDGRCLTAHRRDRAIRGSNSPRSTCPHRDRRAPTRRSTSRSRPKDRTRGTRAGLLSRDQRSRRSVHQGEVFGRTADACAPGKDPRTHRARSALRCHVAPWRSVTR